MLILTSGAWVVGFPVDLEVTGAPPNQAVVFLYGTDLVSAGACPPRLAPNCLAVASPTLLGNDRSNGGGVAVLSPVAPAIPAAEIEIQATTTGAGNLQTDSLIVTLHQAASDNDGDGLTAADEVSITLTDPAVADTDGDGFSDGEELSYGTDPNDPASRPLTWTADLGPFFATKCTPCHIGAGFSGGLDLDLYANVVNRPSDDVPAMDQMPRGGPYLNVDEMALVEGWILAGALE
jgi:hypothetical protein